MNPLILTTKLYIPLSRRKITVRSRLIDRLNENFLPGKGYRRRLTLISAPAGFGKTTLTMEWLAASQRPATWLSLDEADGDLPRFLVYLIAALQKFNPNIGEGVSIALQSLQLPSIETLLTILLNDIAVIPDDFILILDDYHTLDSKQVDLALTFLVEHIPPQMHLVIVTREDPSLPLARLRAQDQLTELRTADLRFTPMESADFLNRVMGLDLSMADIATLESRTEGWIAGLQLAALSMQKNPDTAAFIQSFTGSHHFVLDYLLEEVLHQQSDGVQTFLLRTAILNRLCGPLCDALLVDSPISGQAILESLERANLFIVALDNERHWYRYHHLFGELLRQRLRQSVTPEKLVEYHTRASLWLEKNGEMLEAFHHAMAAGDLNRAADLAETSWQAMDKGFQSAAWLGWVKQLPEEVIGTRPVLCTQIAWALMDAGELDASESRLRDAEQWLEAPPNGMVVVEEAQFRTLPAMIAIARAYNAQARGDLSATVRFAEQALKLTPENDQFRRAQAEVIRGAAHWANGELELAYKALEAWIDRMQKTGNFLFAMASVVGLADILTTQGRLREAVKVYQQSLQHVPSRCQQAGRVTMHNYLGLAMLYHEMGDRETASQYLLKSIELGRHSTLADWPYRRSLAQARLKEADEDLDSALELLDEAKRLYVRSLVPDTRPIEAWMTRVHIKQGQLSKAWDWVRRRGLSVENKLSYLQEFEHITLARVLVADYREKHVKQSIQDAFSFLERLMKAAEAGNRMGPLIEILVVKALAHQTKGESSQAFTALARAIRLAQPEGYLRVFVDEGEPMQSLIMTFRAQMERHWTRQEHELPGYVIRLLSNFSQPAGAGEPGADSIGLLSRRELEVLQLLAQGLSNEEISRQLFIAVSTVKGHNMRIFGKLQAKNRAEAIARGRESGLL